MITLPLTFTPPSELRGADWSDVASYYSAGDPIRQVERASIRAFMKKYRHLLKGRVLDFGAGKQPYRDLVDGEYVPLEKNEWFVPGDFDAIICNQVIQYLDDPSGTVEVLADRLRIGGHLIMTGPTNWEEIESTDLFRFTRAGIQRLVETAGLEIVSLESRASIEFGKFSMSLGWGLVAVK